ncbi:MAG: LptE family protein [Flavobacteriaceae bacterium]|nr:LptE family protein [Flavobacteriaceae bacterium]|tara:strand:+ start:248 stop:769 length:522 start_codon:yes stop_codon:yes gene_type:complete
MKNNIFHLIIFINSLLFIGCGIYSFTGAAIPVGTKTFQVDYFENVAGNKPGSTVEPGLDRDFTLALQDLILNQTNLSLVKNDGDLIYSGQITTYRVSPMSATAENTASQNRLTMGVSVNYTNAKNDEDSFNQSFSFFYDFPADLQVFDVKSDAHKVLLDRITQDIFNASLAKW